MTYAAGVATGLTVALMYCMAVRLFSEVLWEWRVSRCVRRLKAGSSQAREPWRLLCAARQRDTERLLDDLCDEHSWHETGGLRWLTLRRSLIAQAPTFHCARCRSVGLRHNDTDCHITDKLPSWSNKCGGCDSKMDLDVLTRHTR